MSLQYTSPIVNAIGNISLIVDPSGGIASKTILGFAKKSFQDWLKEPSLQSAYEELTKQLKIDKRRFLIIIDDIDRLQDDEITSIMQMVKTIGQLPNVTYLLAYDRKSVWAALRKSEKSELDNPNFAEKIIQQEVELPRPSRTALMSLLEAEVGHLRSKDEDELRWQMIIQYGIWRWLRHPRDVYRFANALKFTSTALNDEVDIDDIFAMEGLRLFDSPTFDWIRRNRDFIFSEGRFQFSVNEVSDEVGHDFNQSLPPQIKREIIQVVCTLFPDIAPHIDENKNTFRTESANSIARRRGVGCEVGYDTYFSLFRSPNAIPKSVVDALLINLGDNKYVETTLQKYIAERDETGNPLGRRLIIA